MAIAAPGTAHATDEFYYNFYGTLQPPLALPQGPHATIRVPIAENFAGPGQRDGKPVDTLRDLFPAIAACWQAPDGLKNFERTDITVRFALRRDGSVIGTPQVTFSKTPADARGKALLIEASLSAIRRCTPVRITPGLGGAIAGRPLSLRFVYEGPRGQGV